MPDYGIITIALILAVAVLTVRIGNDPTSRADE
jgi:hypothetical protein